VSQWLVIGAAGMLGRDLTAALARMGEEVTGVTRSELDITDRIAVLTAVKEHGPQVVVNCAAWTAVDEAEAREKEALQVNGNGAGYVAEACAGNGARLVHVSTDYVFSGDGTRPYSEDDSPAPRTAYGRTKLAGERAVYRELGDAVYVVRTAWLYGAHGPNFIRTMVRLEQERSAVDVVDDQRGQPTWTVDVASQIIALVQADAPGGFYHATSSGETTWYGLAREVFRLLGADEDRVRPVSSGQYPRPAPRPAYSVLGHDAWTVAGIKSADDWCTAVRRAFPALSRLAS
jgi:dTDP-4-dehydrorhamnose reductase